MTITFKPNQNAVLQVGATDRHGNPAQIEPGSLEYGSSDESVVTVEEDPDDETKVKIVSNGDPITAPKVATVTVKADADLGEGVVTIEGTVAIVLEPEQATGFAPNILSGPADN